MPKCVGQIHSTSFRMLFTKYWSCEKKTVCCFFAIKVLHFWLKKCELHRDNSHLNQFASTSQLNRNSFSCNANIRWKIRRMQMVAVLRDGSKTIFVLSQVLLHSCQKKLGKVLIEPSSKAWVPVKKLMRKILRLSSTCVRYVTHHRRFRKKVHHKHIIVNTSKIWCEICMFFSFVSFNFSLHFRFWWHYYNMLMMHFLFESAMMRYIACASRTEA